MKVNYDNLYSGIGVEYRIIGDLFLLGYEAFKMPADFGFDIIASNQKAITLQGDQQEKRKLIQVKSRKFNINHYANIKKSDAGVRKEIPLKFWIQKDVFNKIKCTTNAYLVCCFIEESEDGIYDFPRYFWLSGKHLSFLQQQKHKTFIFESEDNEQFFLQTTLVSEASLIEEYKTLLPHIESSNLSVQHKEKFKRLISKTNAINMHSKMYVTLVFQYKDFTSNEIRESRRELRNELYSLNNLDKDIPSPILMDRPNAK